VGLLAFSVPSPAAITTNASQLREQAPAATHQTAQSAPAIGECLVERVSSVSRVSMLRHGDTDTLTLDDGETLQLLVLVQNGIATVWSPQPYGDATRASVKSCF
jgi:hypothetical protein